MKRAAARRRNPGHCFGSENHRTFPCSPAGEPPSRRRLADPLQTPPQSLRTPPLGRQKIAYDNDAFVSNGNWRQNWQTFDTFYITNKTVAGLTLNYAYVNQINRLFGSDADAPLVAGPPPFDNVQDVAADTHLFNASYALREDLKLGAYAYLMDFPDKKNWDNHTFGGSVQGEWLGLKLYGEAAWQDKAGFNADDDALESVYLYTELSADHLRPRTCPRSGRRSGVCQ